MKSTMGYSRDGVGSDLVLRELLEFTLYTVLRTGETVSIQKGDPWPK